MKILKWLILVLLVLIAAGAGAGFWFLNSSKPQYKGELFLDGIDNQIEIFFDKFGIPHIYANSEQDAYFGLGYVHAQERLFQMELLRRVGGGRLAEIFGPGLVETDQFLRTMGINEIAELSAREYLSENSQPFQKAARAYLTGVNAFIINGPTPPEFTLLGIPKQKFTPADIYRIVGYMGFNFNTAVRTDPLLTAIGSKLGPQYLKDLVINTVSANTAIPTFAGDSALLEEVTSHALKVLESLPVPEFIGSNSWVVGPGKTRSGYPMLANDAHIGFSQPAVWYEAHLNAPGFNFYGNHLAGFPFALIGHNEFHAWGLTIFPNDDMDFFREKADPNNARRIWNTDHWEELQSRKETIRVKGADDLKYEVLTSRHGPIINEVNALVDSIEQQPVSFFWTYLKFPSKALQTAYDMAHSQSMDDFREAVSQLEAPGLNITYADREGNIGWWTVARLLKRADHVESKILLDGSSGMDEPLGWHPFSDNPRSENPPEGFVYSANNQPDSLFGFFHPGYYYPGLRGQRITALLSQKYDWDMESFAQMIMDDKSPGYPEIGNKIVMQLEGDLNETEREVVQILKDWDGSHGLKDIGPSIFYPLTNRIQENLHQDELGQENYRVYATTLVARRTLPFILENDSSIWWDDQNTAEVETRKQIINRSFRETVEQLAFELGPDPWLWNWERMHILEHVHAVGRQKPLNHLFNVGPFPSAGGDEVINKMDFNKDSFPYKIKSGASMRIMIDLADIENSLSVIPTGQSGHPLSRHYRDQAVLYNSGRFRAQHMNKAIIQAEAQGMLLLKPARTD